ncbi:carboxypeptidase M32 [Isachenkonia alkalipeptolytica]|uniref:Metal-dependent carboxypeptidase n=1 Tax=Isachenkonia alkalipeptolytica TaxID=2565777 RepID=A0AA44BEU1_9CLOT|nr:carboxypeptidase M32 [Isachenkonia alkalipeptolytica]NBG89307.1 carboxypeptidase M32 [Isachenkonia alkalipeptolytica]
MKKEDNQKEENQLQELLKRYMEISSKIQHYREMAGLAHWDMATYAPKEGRNIRSEALGTLSTEAFKMSVSPEMQHLLGEFSREKYYNELPEKYQKSIEKDVKHLEKFQKIPEEEYRDYVILTSRAQNIWEKAKADDDFEIFRPYLEKIVDFNRRMSERLGYEGHAYNALLDRFEEGMTVEKLDAIFGELKEGVLNILNKIQNASKKPNKRLESVKLPVEKQKILSEKILKKIGYDFECGRLDESIHPFTIGLNPKDVRVTTRYQEDFFKTALFGTIHEGGHGMYEQNIPMELFKTSAGSAASTGMHESQSRFWENVVGRSEFFWKGLLPEFQELFQEEVKNVSLEEMVEYINIVEPSMIRVEADELTYSLHIILRYELEKDLIGGKISVEELPERWNEKMEDILGIKPRDNREGVLQDMHWAGGMIGYFPTYALGNLYALQLTKTLQEDVPEFNSHIEHQNFAPIKEWMVKKVHHRGSLRTAEELIEEITGEGLTVKPYLSYLDEKYQKIYQY